MVLRISLEVGFLSWGLLVWNDLVCCLAVSPFFTFLLLTEKYISYISYATTKPAMKPKRVRLCRDETAIRTCGGSRARDGLPVKLFTIMLLDMILKCLWTTELFVCTKGTLVGVVILPFLILLIRVVSGDVIGEGNTCKTKGDSSIMPWKDI